MPDNGKKTYVVVGLGGRHAMFRDAVTKDFASTSRLAALCDANEGRLRLAQLQVREQGGGEIPGYLADDFEKMIRETRPDTVIVTTRDSFHDLYICRAMELGCDVITEKPMTTDEFKCRRILDTQRRTGRRVRVTFNYRYAPPRSQVKDLLLSGAIGNVLSVDFHWLLDTHHGADYFRRWHRNKRHSGGLMVHKATHHFDLVNWWLSSVPETVYASGQRRFYTPRTGDRYGLTRRGARCRGCAEAGRCPFFVDLAGNEGLRRLYLDCESYDGYIRDACVFSESIDIEDTMNVAVDYASGARMAYSLNAFCAWEGYTVAFNGTRGRLEHKCEESVYINADGSVPGALKKDGTWIRVYPHGAPAYGVDIWQGVGGHGGGDSAMLQDIFRDDAPPDRYLRAADQRAGAWSILTGIAANHSMKEGRPIRVTDLVKGLDQPDYAPMPTDQDPLPPWKRG